MAAPGGPNADVGRHELDTGIRCVEHFATQGQRRSEDANPQMVAHIRDWVEIHTQADPEVTPDRRYTNMSARELRGRLRLDKGCTVADGENGGLLVGGQDRTEPGCHP